MANQTNIHKKMDKILQKLATLEENDKALSKQTNYLAQLVVLAKQDSQAMLRDMGQLLLEVKKSSERAEERAQDSQAMVRDMGHILLEVKKSSERTEERVAEILTGTRRH